MKNWLYYLAVTFLCLSQYSYANDTEPRLHVCAVASTRTKGLSQLLTSCERVHIDIDILGLGLPYKGNGQKLVFLKSYLSKIPDSDVVLFVDGFDVLILQDKKTIMDKFLAIGAPFVISVELDCGPFPNLASRYPPSPTAFRFINAGLYMGYAWFMKTLLEELSPIQANKSDQGQLTVYYLDHQSDFYLDYYCELFLNLLCLRSSDILINPSRGTVDCLITGSTPCMVHGNGRKKYLYEKIYKALFGRYTHP